MGRTKDEKLVYFAKLKDLIETYRKYTPWDSFEDVASLRDSGGVKAAKNQCDLAEW